MGGGWVQSLAEELKSSLPPGYRIKRHKIEAMFFVTNSIKTLKVVPTRKNYLKEGEEVKDCDDFERWSTETLGFRGRPGESQPGQLSDFRDPSVLSCGLWEACTAVVCFTREASSFTLPSEVHELLLFHTLSIHFSPVFPRPTFPVSQDLWDACQKHASKAVFWRCWMVGLGGPGF